MINPFATAKTAASRSDDQGPVAEIGGNDIKGVIVRQKIKGQRAFRPDDDVILIALDVTQELTIAIEQGITRALFVFGVLRYAGIHQDHSLFAHHGRVGEALCAPGPAKSDQDNGPEYGQGASDDPARVTRINQRRGSGCDEKGQQGQPIDTAQGRGL